MAGIFVQQASDVRGVLSGGAVGDVKEDQRVSMLKEEAGAQPFVPGSAEQQLSNFLTWIVKYPLEQNNPRATTGAIAVWKSNGVICVLSSEKIPDVFKKFVTEGILGAPVINRAGRYTGAMDLLDLVSFTVSLFNASKFERSAKGWASFFEEEKRWKDATVREVMKHRPLVPRIPDPTYLVLKGFSLFHPYEILARTGLRRVPVIDERSNIVGLVTQSMLISLLRQNRERLGPILDRKVRDMEPIFSPLVTAKISDKAIDVFNIMSERNISAVPIVDNEGTLVDTLSVRDLRGIGTDIERYHRLFYEVAFYKELVKTEYRKQTPGQPIYCTRDHTFNQVLTMMDDGNIHRVWVVEMTAQQKPRPIAAISQKDMLFFTLKECGL